MYNTQYTILLCYYTNHVSSHWCPPPDSVWSSEIRLTFTRLHDIQTNKKRVSCFYRNENRETTCKQNASRQTPRIMKHYSPTGRRNRGRPLKRLLDTWDRNGSTSGLTAWQTYDDDDHDENRESYNFICCLLWMQNPACRHKEGRIRTVCGWAE